jgi:hypothetical protein
MPVMTKGPQGDDIVILSRTKYDQLIAAANEDATNAEPYAARSPALRAAMKKPFRAPRLMHSLQQRRRSHSSEKSAA